MTDLYSDYSLPLSFGNGNDCGDSAAHPVCKEVKQESDRIVEELCETTRVPIGLGGSQSGLVADAAWLCCLVVVCAADVMLISTSLICTVDAARVCMPSVVPRRRAQRPRPVHWAGRVATAIHLVLTGSSHGRMGLDGLSAVFCCAVDAGAACALPRPFFFFWFVFSISCACSRTFFFFPLPFRNSLRSQLSK